jgi:hypothetical protein
MWRRDPVRSIDRRGREWVESAAGPVERSGRNRRAGAAADEYRWSDPDLGSGPGRFFALRLEILTAGSFFM